MQKLYDGTPYELMPETLRTPKTKAISCAISEGLKQILEYSKKTVLYADLENVSDEVLNTMAAELRTQYYDQKAPRIDREEIVKKTMGWYMIGGTGIVLEEYMATLYAGGKVTEWYEYGGEPYYFKAIVSIPEETILPVGASEEIIQRINRYKNVRSWLEALEFHFLFEYLVKIQYEEVVKLYMEFYPRMNMKPLLLDGTWKLNGKIRLNGYAEEMPADLYPVCLRFLMETRFDTDMKNSGIKIIASVSESLQYEAGIDVGAYAKEVVEYPMEIVLQMESEVEMSLNAEVYIGRKLNSKWKLDGTAKLNGGKITL